MRGDCAAMNMNMNTVMSMHGTIRGCNRLNAVDLCHRRFLDKDTLASTPVVISAKKGQDA